MDTKMNEIRFVAANLVGTIPEISTASGKLLLFPKVCQLIHLVIKFNANSTQVSPPERHYIFK